MANSALPSLTAQTTPHAADLLYIVDTTDTTQSPQGTSKAITYTNLTSLLATLVSPSFTTPTLGVATATSVNKLIITAPATTATLTVANNKTLTVSNTLTLAGVDGKTLTVNNSLTLAGTDATVMTFPSTSDTVLTLTATQALTNKTLTDSTNNVMAKSLKSATTTVDVSSATAPTTGQVLTATGASAATWQTPSASTDGWITDPNSLVYVSASSFKIVGADKTAQYTKGTRIKFTNNSTTFYGVVASSVFSTDTTVTLATTSDYSIANSAITNPFYSYQSNPQGYPGWFNWTPTLVGFSADPTNASYRFAINGRVCHVMCSQDSDGTSNSATFTISLPVSCVSTAHEQFLTFCYAHDNGAAAVPAQVAITSVSPTVIQIGKDAAGNGFTSSGGKRAVGLSMVYEI